MPNVLLPGKAVFAFEIAQAKLLGFKLTVANAPSSVAVHLMPMSNRARVVCARQRGAMIEASCEVLAPDERLDATREAIRAALTLAKDAGA